MTINITVTQFTQLLAKYKSTGIDADGKVANFPPLNLGELTLTCVVCSCRTVRKSPCCSSDCSSTYRPPSLLLGLLPNRPPPMPNPLIYT